MKPHMPLVIYIFSLCAFSLGFTEFVSIGLVSVIALDLQIGVAAVGTAVTAYAAGVVIGAPILTALTTHWPRKRLLLLTMLLFSITNLAVGFSPDLLRILSARFISGLAHGVFFAVASGAAIELVEKKRAGAAISLVFGGLTIAMALAVPLGTYLGSLFPWRFIFMAIAVFGGIGVLGLMRYMPDIQAIKTSSIRSNLHALINPQLLIGASVTMLAYCGAFSLYTYISPLLLQVTQISVVNLSIMLLIYGCAAAVGNVLGGKMTDYFGVERACLFIMIGLALVLFMIGLFAHFIIITAFLIALLGGLSYAAVPALQTRLIRLAQHYEPESITVIAGLNIAGFNLGLTLGSLIGGATILLTGNVLLTAFVGTFIVIIGIVVLIKHDNAQKSRL